jgi:hypothetical protein
MGEVVDLSQGVANELLAMGMALIAPEPALEPEPALVCPPKPRRTAKISTPVSTPTPED